MTSYRVKINNVKNIKSLDVSFDFPERNIIAITGRNGTGKTTLVKSFKLLSDPQVFERTSGLSSIGVESKVSIDVSDGSEIIFSYNEKIKALDTRDALPDMGLFISELPIPYGDRFKHFSLVARYDYDLRTSIATFDFCEASELISFLSSVYPNNKGIANIKEVELGKNKFYFLLGDGGYYLREDHFSSGEFFLIQLFRLISSGAKLILIDEFDISLDSSAQVHFIQAVERVLEEYDSKLIVTSHSLAFMETVPEGDLYYLECMDGIVSLEARSFGYAKSDLYGFKGRDRYILTEDDVLCGFIEFLIATQSTRPFFTYEIIPVGGQPQIDAMATRNDSQEIFGLPSSVIIVIDRDIANQVKYKGRSKVFTSPVDDIEVYIWRNKARLLPNVNISFQEANSEKKTAKTFWKKITRQQYCSENQLYQMVVDENKELTDSLVESIMNHLDCHQ